MEIDRLEYYIGQRLLNLTDITVYNRKAPDNPDETNFPYVVMNIESINYLVENRGDCILNLDFWNDSNDDSEIIQASKDIKNGRTVGENTYIGFKCSTQNESEGFYKSDIDFESPIIDQEPDISHYNQRYIIKNY